MDNREAVNWLINISADIGKAGHSDLWHYEQALTEIKDMLESAQPEERTEERTETHACVLIRQQDAVELAMKYCPDDDGTVQCDGDIRELLDELENLPPVQPEITQDQLEEYCKKRCLTVITDDLYYKLTSGLENTATLATMSSAVTPHNDTFTKFVDELLAYEQRNDMFNLTTKERAEFQSYVRERMEL